MTLALMYSMRPCPYGCFLSGFFDASLIPIIVMIEESASERLLTASSMIEIDEDARPTAALRAASKTFAPMLIVDVSAMLFSRGAELLLVSILFNSGSVFSRRLRFF